jgi:histidine kinase
MMPFNSGFRRSLAAKLIYPVGFTLLVSISIWAYSNIRYQEEKIMKHILEGTNRLTNTIQLGARYAMMTNSRDDINQIINNIAKQKEIENIRIYNKEGQIKFSNQITEVDRMTNIKAEACDICHKADPPLTHLDLSKRKRMFLSKKGYHLLGIISPIYNEPSCATDDCHFHPKDKKVLGALDVVVSLEKTQAEIFHFERGIIILAVSVIVVASSIIFLVVFKFIQQPINKLIDETHRIAKGDYFHQADIASEDEIGELAGAINKMGGEIGKNQAELKKQKDEFRNLFERVPCEITVQDKDYKLLRYNRKFAEKFKPKLGDFCFHAYKGRTSKCEICPVEKTFEDGNSHYSNEMGHNKDGSVIHWMVVTAPVKDANDQIVAAMEMCLDITHIKQLEERLEKSEKKYQAIFNNIPNPVFAMDKHTLNILDCNNSAQSVYGYSIQELINTSFMNLFFKDERETYEARIKSANEINQARHQCKNGKSIFVNIRISPSEYEGRKVFLITTSDITKRLEVEQQLIQASKMATLGEMATGVAHELNQPLSVIKTASSFFIKKVDKGEDIKPEILHTLSTEIDSHVDRASKIINHMREFGRKSDMSLETVQINDVLRRAFEIFSQQLKLRGIDVIWDLDDDLPPIKGEPGRLEQVFINLLINARDAIEARYEKYAQPFTAQETNKPKKIIYLKTYTQGVQAVIEVEDTGEGVPPGVLDKIFEPFFTTKEVGKGTGLGLSISYGIIKDCGGTIKAGPGKTCGACFTLAFPALKDSSDQDAAS